MQVEIHSGEAKVINSGTVFSYEDQPVEVGLKEIDGHDSNFRIRFEFAYDNQDKTQRTEEIKIDDGTLFALRLVNYRNSLGSGMLKPLEIASNGNGNSLFLTFMISSWGDNLAKRIDYTIFKRHMQEDKNGKV